MIVNIFTVILLLVLFLKDKQEFQKENTLFYMATLYIINFPYIVINI